MKKIIITESQFKKLLEITAADSKFGAMTQNNTDAIQDKFDMITPDGKNKSSQFNKGEKKLSRLVNGINSSSHKGYDNYAPNMGDKSMPRGYRNNNPLNIRISKNNAWKGKVQNNTDGSFEQFVSPQYGYRAAARLIKNYIKGGRTTVSSIISKWAPNNENNTNGYINRVCQTTGFQPNTTIEMNNSDKLSKLLYAMAIVENGNVSGQPKMKEIQDGVNLA